MSIALSVVLCSHNPRPDYLQRTLASLRKQTLEVSNWELLLVDNNSQTALSESFAVSWHKNGRHIREEHPGLTPARVRGIAESQGSLVVFVDDDNVLDPDYLARAQHIRKSQPQLGAFGSGALEPEFEVTPPSQLGPWLSMLALRTVATPRSSDDWADKDCLPWGAGLCVSRAVAAAYDRLVRQLKMSSLDRCGERLFCGGDDLFSFVACEDRATFGIFPELRLRHLISARRLTEEYILRLVHDHAYSHTMLNYLLSGEHPAPDGRFSRLRTLAHGLRRGRFSMQCRTAERRGRAAAGELIRAQLQEGAVQRTVTGRPETTPTVVSDATCTKTAND